MKFSIYTTHYSQSDSIPCDGIYPIQVGKALTEEKLYLLDDFSGDNISRKNPEYCELTAQYWVWKNKLDSDYIGFMHYRRHICFKDGNKNKENPWGLIEYDEINSKYISECGLTPDSIEKQLDGNDILIAEEWDVKNSGSKNNYELYKNSEFLHIDDYNAVIRIVNELYPDYSSAFSDYNSSSKGFYTNIFVMRKDIYEEYSEWVFNILDRLEGELDLSNYNSIEKRVIGHIAERLLGVYIYKKKAEGNLKIKELKRTLINNVDRQVVLAKENFADKNTPIILNFNDKYAPIAGALIESITKFSSNENNYDIFVLGNNISKENKERLDSIIESFKNICITYIDMNKFNLFKNIHTHAHFSKETYYRLYIPKLFSNFTKVLYIDADMIVQRDLNDLMHIDMDEHPIAAVQCYVMQMLMHDKVPSSYQSGAMPADLYVKNYLKMSDPKKYFQAGTIIMDIEKLRSLNFVEKAEKLISEKDFWFLDQDIMNSIIDGDVELLKYNWNTLHGNDINNTLEKKLPVEYRSFYLEAKCNPYIIHYAGDRKPWIDRHVYFSDIWWASYARTPWFTVEILSRLESLESGSSNMFKNSIFIKFRYKLISVINKVAPVGTKRRLFLLQKYRYIRSMIK